MGHSLPDHNRGKRVYMSLRSSKVQVRVPITGPLGSTRGVVPPGLDHSLKVYLLSDPVVVGRSVGTRSVSRGTGQNLILGKKGGSPVPTVTGRGTVVTVPHLSPGWGE